jgi:tail protein
MDLRLLTWNGISINNGSPFSSYFPKGQKVNLSSNPVNVNRSGNYPYLSGIVLNPNTIMIGVTIAAGSNINTNREVLKQYFSAEDNTRHNLVAEDGSGGTQHYLTGFVIRVLNQGDDENAFFVIFQVEYPFWRLVTATDTTWSVTASAQTQAITNAGNRKVGPKITLTPTSAKTGGLSYRRWIPVYNNMDTSFIGPVDITDESATGGGLDTATLTTAKMQADGDDFRVWVDGVEVDRWLQDMDTASTQCWININLAPRHEGTLKTTLASATADITVAFTQNKANLEVLKWLKSANNTIFLIESEAFQYSAANVNLVTYQITSCKRERKGTTAAGHTAGVTIRHIEHDIWILYGDSTLTAPDVDDDNKPIFSLASTNGAWAFTNFYSTSAARPGAWKGEVLASRTGLSYAYTGDTNTFVSPSTELGLALVGSADFQVQNETGTLDWIFSHPAAITTVLFSGDKYMTGSWPAIVGLQYLQPNTVWFTADNQTEPAVAYAWEPFGPTTANISTPYPNSIRFVIDGLLSSVISEMALIQFDTVTTTFSSANLPTISVGAEAAAYYFDLTITNNTTGEYIKVAVPCVLNETVTIDCESKDAYLSDGQRVNVTLSTDRAEWLDLSPGSNTLQYDDTGTNAVTVHIIHRDRTL